MFFDDFEARALSFSRNNALSLAYAAEAVYSDRNAARDFALENGFTEFLFFDEAGTQAFLMGNSAEIVLAFRGTETDSLADIATDLRVRKVGGPLGGYVHRGFLSALLQVWDDRRGFKGIEHSLKDMKKRLGSPSVWVTGHSLGAALATLATAFLVEAGQPVYGLYTFGSPRVGDSAFASAFDSRFKRAYRVVNNNDVVTRVPPRSLFYDHVGEFWYLSEMGQAHQDPGAWFVFLDRAFGRLCDVGEVNTDGIKDHAMNNDPDGYIPQLIRSKLSL